MGLIPCIGWLRRYQKGWLRPDVMAGLTAAAVVIPKAMAYATIAGLPVQVGLYTAFLPMLIYAVLGTSRPLSVSTTTTIAILTGAVLGQVAPGGGDPASLMSALATLTLLVGGMLVLCGLVPPFGVHRCHCGVAGGPGVPGGQSAGPRVGAQAGHQRVPAVIEGASGGRNLPEVLRVVQNSELGETLGRERERWDDYMAAYEEMIRHTASMHAPWYVVPADTKWFTRLVVAAAIIEALDDMNLAYPKVDAEKRKELEAARSMLEGKGPARA